MKVSYGNSRINDNINIFKTFCPIIFREPIAEFDNVAFASTPVEAYSNVDTWPDAS